MYKKNIIILIIAVILIGVVVWFLKFKNSVETPNLGVSTTTETQEKNYFEINDELAGIYFKVGKKFDRMSANQLQTKNPNFIYGFSAKSDSSAACFISQTKRQQQGQITVGQLRDGVFEQMKRANPDAKIDEAKIIDTGENNNKGIKMKMSYADVDKTPMIQWETVGITDKLSTFAFCNCPRAVIELYQEEFELFLNSLRIK